MGKYNKYHWLSIVNTQNSTLHTLTIKVIIVFFLLFSTHTKAEISSVKELTSDPYFHQKIEDLWLEVKPTIENHLKNSNKNTAGLYNTQILTHSFMKYAFKNNKTQLIDDLLNVYSISLRTMNFTDQYLYYYFENQGRQTQHTLDKYYGMWVNGENNKSPSTEIILYNAQFLGLISEAIVEISKIEPSRRTLSMMHFVNNFSPILDSHYKRWVIGLEVEGIKNVGPFQYNGFQCRLNGIPTPSLLTSREAINLLLDNKVGNNHSYCNAVSDVDLWIITGVNNYLTSYITDPILITKPAYFNELKNYLNTANLLLKSRLSATDLTDFSGNPTQGLLFDTHSWSDHVNFSYAGYSGNTFPTSLDKTKVKNIGWDTTHGRRFIFVFESLYKNKDILGFSFPNQTDMEQLANQFIFGYFNKNFTKPLFTNFMDGSDGWYNVKGTTAYPPSSSTYAILSGGFGFYQTYNQQVDNVITLLYNTIHSTNPSIRDFVIKHYEHYLWVNGKPSRRLNFTNPNLSTKLLLLEFYSSMSDSKDTIGNILSTPFKANFSANTTTIYQGDSVKFTDESNKNPISWRWLFLGGNSNESTSQNPTIIYNNVGTYKVELTAINTDGNVNTEAKSGFITVIDKNLKQAPLSPATTSPLARPKADFSANVTTITQGESIRFTDESSNSPTAWNWLFLGGKPISSKQQHPTILYSTPGTYKVQLVVKNADGKGSSKVQLGFITVLENKPTPPPIIIPTILARPKAEFSANVTTITQGETIHFTDNSSNNPTSWNWLFLGGKPITSREQNPIITYNKPGTYKVQLVVRNADGKGSAKIKQSFIKVLVK